jgi:hypothetical protein
MHIVKRVVLLLIRLLVGKLARLLNGKFKGLL